VILSSGTVDSPLLFASRRIPMVTQHAMVVAIAAPRRFRPERQRRGR